MYVIAAAPLSRPALVHWPTGPLVHWRCRTAWLPVSGCQRPSTRVTAANTLPPADPVHTATQPSAARDVQDPRRRRRRGLARDRGAGPAPRACWSHGHRRPRTVRLGGVRAGTGALPQACAAPAAVATPPSSALTPGPASRAGPSTSAPATRRSGPACRRWPTACASRSSPTVTFGRGRTCARCGQGAAAGARSSHGARPATPPFSAERHAGRRRWTPRSTRWHRTRALRMSRATPRPRPPGASVCGSRFAAACALRPPTGLAWRAAPPTGAP